MKPCSTCKQIFTLDNFHNSKKTKDGKTSRCKRCAIQAAADWAKEHPELIRERCRVYANLHSDKRRERFNKWKLDNPEHFKFLCRTSAHIRRARIRQAPGNPPAYPEWIQLVNSYGNKCLCCGATNICLTVDHVVPIVKGGSIGIENLQPLCPTCNYRKKDKTIDYRGGLSA